MFNFDIDSNNLCRDLSRLNDEGIVVFPVLGRDGNFRVKYVPSSFGLQKDRKGYSKVAPELFLELLKDYSQINSFSVRMRPEEKNKEGRRDYSGFSLDERTNVSNRLVNFIPHLKDKFIVLGIVDEKLSAKDAEVQIFIDEKALREIKTRQGQPEFRRALMAVYESTCQITGSKVERVLEAAHIVPHAEETNYSIHNGFLLRSDIHTLFDLGVIQIKPSGKKLMVSVDDDLLSSEYGQYHEKELDIIPSDEMLKNISDRNKKYFNS